MKFIAIGDVHACEYLSFSRKESGDSGVTHRLGVICSALRYVIDYAIQNKIKHIFNLGDIFDKKDQTSALTILKVKEVFDYAAINGISLIHLTGNHDRIIKSKTTNLSICQILPGLTHSSPISTTLQGGEELVLIPDGDEEATHAFLDHIQAKEKHYPRQELRIMLGHLSIFNAKATGDFAANFGWQLNDLHPECYDLMLFADFHKRQCLIPSKAYYVGALLQQNFGHVGEPQGFCVVSLVSKSVQDVSWVELPGFPEFKQISGTMLDHVGSMEKFENEYKNCYVKLKSDEPLTRSQMQRAHTLFSNTVVLKSVIEAPLTLEEKPRMEFKENSSFYDKICDFIDHSAGELDTDFLKWNVQLLLANKKDDCLQVKRYRRLDVY